MGLEKLSDPRLESFLKSVSESETRKIDNFSSPIAWYILTRKATQTLHHDHEENTSKRRIRREIKDKPIITDVFIVFMNIFIYKK